MKLALKIGSVAILSVLTLVLLTSCKTRQLAPGSDPIPSSNQATVVVK